MINQWDSNIISFLKMAKKNDVKIIMVGGGAVNFHGYQRHSADVDFWVDASQENLKKLLITFQELKYDINDFPKAVYERDQNISVKFSPYSMSLELITRFSINKTFEEAYHEAEEAVVENEPYLKWKVLSLDDLITSKIKSNRSKDLMDIQELQKIHTNKK